MKAMILTDTDDGSCVVARFSDLSGKINHRTISCTSKEILEWQRSVELIQQALPQLSIEDREFLLSGSTPEEWEEAFGGGEK